MKNSYSNSWSLVCCPGRNFLFSLFILALSGGVCAQVSQDFSTSTTGTNHYVDGGSGTVQHILVNNMAPQTAPNAATMGTTLGYQATFTPTRMPSVGLTDGELFGAIDVTAPNTPDNDMGTIAIDFTANPPTGGNNNVYLLDDPDGLVTLRFNPVLVGAGTMFSLDYIIHNTSYENSDGADDRLEIYLVNTADGARTPLLSLTNAAMADNERWQTLSSDLTAVEGQTVQLVVEFDTNSSSEEMAIDNISFSSGTLITGWPMCVNPTVPAVAQFPVSVCPGVPFRLTIAGALNNATEWVIYSDAAATEEVGRTSSTQFDVFAGAMPGVTYYVRGEGQCSDLMILTPLAVMTNDPANCLPDATPGTSFEEPLGSSGDYFDTGDPTVDHDLINNQGQPAVTHRFAAQELGFTTQFLTMRSGTSGEAGLTDGDAFGVRNDAAFSFPDGDQGLVIEDTDGRIIVFFTPVDLAGLTDVTVTFDYFVNPSTYESSATGNDNFVVGMDNRGAGSQEIMINTFGDGADGLAGLVTGQWTTFTYTLTQEYTEPSPFAIAADFDSGSERVMIDNISFSAGTIVCQDAAAPVVTCPDDITIDAGENCTAVASFGASATDDCTRSVPITYSQDSGTAFDVGVNTVTATATDESGESSTCTFNVTVNDVTPPVLDCPTVTVQLDSATNCAFVVPDASLDPLATDNCGTVTLLSGSGLPSLAGDSIFVETTEVSWTATDAAGLTATCTQQVNVIVPPNCFPTSVAGQDASAFSAVRATPNPFRAGTTLSFELPVNTRVGVEILDLSGRVLATDVVAPSGNNTYSWYWDAQRQALPAGVYLARLRAAGSVYTQRLVLVE